MKNLMRRRILMMIAEAKKKIRLFSSVNVLSSVIGAIQKRIKKSVNSAIRLYFDVVSSISSSAKSAESETQTNVGTDSSLYRSETVLSGTNETDVAISSILESVGINGISGSENTEIDITVALKSAPPAPDMAGGVGEETGTLSSIRATGTGISADSANEFFTSSEMVKRSSNHISGQTAFGTVMNGMIGSFRIRFTGGSALVKIASASSLHAAQGENASASVNVTEQIESILHAAKAQIVSGENGFEIVSNGTITEESSKVAASQNAQSKSYGEISVRQAIVFSAIAKAVTNCVSSLQKIGTTISGIVAEKFTASASISSSAVTVLADSATEMGNSGSIGKPSQRVLARVIESLFGADSTISASGTAIPANSGAYAGANAVLSLAADWEYPVVSGTNISITQSYQTLQLDTNLIVG